MKMRSFVAGWGQAKGRCVKKMKMGTDIMYDGDFDVNAFHCSVIDNTRKNLIVFV